MKKEEKATGDSRRGVGEYEQAAIPLKQQLKEITLLMQLMAANGADDSEEFQTLAQKAGKLKDAINATNDQINTFTTGDKFEQNLKVAKGGFDALSGAAQTYEGILQTVGVGSEDVERGIQKLVAIQSVQSGVTQLYEALQKESAFMLGVNALKTNILSAAQATYTTAVGTSTGALKFFRIALLSTGIGAIIAGIIALVTNWDKLTASTLS